MVVRDESVNCDYWGGYVKFWWYFWIRMEGLNGRGFRDLENGVCYYNFIFCDVVKSENNVR